MPMQHSSKAQPQPSYCGADTASMDVVMAVAGDSADVCVRVCSSQCAALQGSGAKSVRTPKLSAIHSTHSNSSFIVHLDTFLALSLFMIHVCWRSLTWVCMNAFVSHQAA